MRASLRLGSVLVSLALASVACGDDGGGEGGSGTGDDTSSSPSTGTEAGSTSTGDATTGGTGGAECEPPATLGPDCDFPDSVETDPQIVEFEAVLGTVVTVDGDPVANDAIQVCGINLCLYGDTDGTGTVAVPQGNTPLDVPVFKVGDGLSRARIGYPVPEGGGEIEMEGTTIDLVDSETTLEGGAVAEADGVILTIAEGAGVGLNTFDFPDCGQDTLRAAVVPAGSIDVIAPDQDFVALVGLGPNETIFCPAAGLSIPNDTDLEAGTEVEFVQQSLETGQFFGAYGQWEQVAVGRVSDDGASFVTDDGEGIPILTTTGVRPL